MKGTTVGHYTVLEKLGEGGMGEVFLARDTRLGRDAAIKVLPPLFAEDASRVARFRREAQILATLNHPNIAAIYGLEESAGTLALALEYVPGEDLAERLARGAVPVDEAIAIAKQIAEALEGAHERGVIHRDLKPANIKITADGKVKVLDFGLAKAFAGEGAADSLSGMAQPTVTGVRPNAGGATEAGMILGTAAYMSPEQARGKPVDKRADIWAFGAVCYEMLTGQRLFAGETISDVLAAVLRADVDLTLLPASVPADLRRLVGRCLERDPRNRLHDIADARLAIEDAMRGGGPPSPAVRSRPASRWVSLAPWAVAGVATAAAIALGLRATPAAPPATKLLSVFGVLVPDQHILALSQSPLIDISADGRTVLFAAQDAKAQAIFRRTIDRMTISRIEGTEGAEHPAISPDGRSVAFFAGGMLRKVDAGGGVAVGVADALAPRGLAWARDGSIVFSPLYNSTLFRVAATGGAPAPVTTLDLAKGERTHRWPQVLPDGRSVIFTVGLASSPGDYDGGNIDAQRLDTGERRTVLRGARMARYSALGYLVYQRRKTLLAVKFDPQRLETIGEPFAIQEDVGGDSSSGAGYFSVSDTGVIAFAPEASIPKDRQLALVAADGRETVLNIPAASFFHPRFSPDGGRLALSIGSGSAGDDDVFVVDIATLQMQRLTFDQGHGLPMWSPDGRRVVYTDGRNGATGLTIRNADGSGGPITVASSAESMLADGWLPDGKRLAVTNTQKSIDIQIVDPASPATTTPLFASQSAGEYAAAFTPDGQYVAYTTTETGTDEVIVETFPPGRGKWQISTTGGMTPAWSRDGRKLYFVGRDGLMVSDVSTAGGFRPGVPRLLLTGAYEFRTVPYRNFDVGPDGRLVLVKRQLRPPVPAQVVLLEGWSGADPARK